MRHASELPKVVSVYLETAEHIDFVDFKIKACAIDFVHVSYPVQRGCGGPWGNFHRHILMEGVDASWFGETKNAPIAKASPVVPAGAQG